MMNKAHSQLPKTHANLISNQLHFLQTKTPLDLDLHSPSSHVLSCGALNLRGPSAMSGKPILVFILVAASLVALSLFVGTVDFREHVFEFLRHPSPSPPVPSPLPSVPSPSPSAPSPLPAVVEFRSLHPPCPSPSPLKVYMYDLPWRFNFGMLPRQSSVPDETPVTAKTLPSWPEKSGLNRQHSVEYWMTASLLYDGEEREAVRISDPELADVFFVPFFSSLSFNMHGRKMKGPEMEVDRKLQVEVLDFLRKSKHWQRSGGRDHVIPIHHPNAFRFLRKQVNASILIVADFGRYPKTTSNLRKDVVAPYVHNVESYSGDEGPSPFESRRTLLFFRGGIKRKAEGFVRSKLAKILSGYADVQFQSSSVSDESIKLSTEGMRSSKFCLHLAGDTPSSCRLFDAIVSHCVPVIISDKIELPYEDELDYSEFAIFFSDNEALTPGLVVEHLRKVPKQRWLQMWNQLKVISRHFEFQYPPKKDDAVNMLWREIRRKLPAEKLALHRSRRLKIPDWWGKWR